MTDLYDLEDELTEMLIPELLARPRRPLRDAETPRVSGVYALGWAKGPDTGRPEVEMYSLPFTTGRAALYVGAACGDGGLWERRGRHSRNLDCSEAFSADDFWFTWVEGPPAMALAAERVLIQELTPPWNDGHLGGAGSKRQGDSRQEHQAPSAWDALPGHRREWARTPSLAQEVMALAALGLSLVTFEPARAIWPEYGPPT